MVESIKVFAPASVANVAVGYDILGFALEKPGDEIIVRKGKSPGLVITEITGDKGKLSYDITQNTASFGALKLMQKLGEEKHPLEMVIHKKMPFGSGLGSSAASAVAGVFAVNQLLKTGLTKREILPFAVEAEQLADGSYHADNVAPSLLGGMILIRDNATLDLKKLYIPEGISIAIIYPHIEILTRDSRNILSPNVPLEQVIAQSGNLASFVAAMYTSDFDLLSRCLRDVIIEPQRASLIPYFYPLQEMALECGALGFSISGAGPAMFAFCNNTAIADTIVSRCQSFLTTKNIRSDCFISAVNHEGAIVC